MISDKGDIGMKMIIRNCPAIYGIDDGFLCSYREDDENEKYCLDCTDCVPKHIVELCKNIDCPCEYQGADCWECSRIGAKTFADKILKLLDIQEAE